MDFLNKAIAQLSELFRSMTPGARIMAGLLLAVVVISVGYLFQHSATGPDTYLFGGEPISNGQLDRVEAAIAKAGLSDFQREGSRIRDAPRGLLGPCGVDVGVDAADHAPPTIAMRCLPRSQSDSRGMT